jgi:hypothetical protein
MLNTLSYGILLEDAWQKKEKKEKKSAIHFLLLLEIPKAINSLALLLSNLCHYPLFFILNSLDSPLTVKRIGEHKKVGGTFITSLSEWLVIEYAPCELPHTFLCSPKPMWYCVNVCDYIEIVPATCNPMRLV